MLRLLCIRHGESAAYEDIDNEDEEKDIYRQTRTTHLSLHGVSQAHLVGKQISIYRPDVMVNSPFLRADQTAQIISEYSQKPRICPNSLEDLREIRRVVDGKSIYGDLNKEYKKWRGDTIRNLDLTSKFHPNDDSFGEFFQQSLRFKHWVRQNYEGQTVVVVSHSQLLAMLITSVLHGDHPAPTTLFSSFNKHFMNHGALTIITHDYRHGWQMKEKDFNITSHLG